MVAGFDLMRAGGLIVLLCGSGLVACDDDDIGKRCGTAASGLPEDPVGGENPVNEVVRIERDGACESFQCLRHRGLEPYCTRPCEPVELGSKRSCDADSDCKDDQYCLDGTCADDDCPKGFWCRDVQEVGPLSDQQFCTRKENCRQVASDGSTEIKNLECEAIGEIECVTYGCFDACLLEGTPCQLDSECPAPLTCQNSECTCEYHELLCQTERQIIENNTCRCPGGVSGSLECPDATLECSLITDTELWPTNAVGRVGVCEHKEPKK